MDASFHPAARWRVSEIGVKLGSVKLVKLGEIGVRELFY